MAKDLSKLSQAELEKLADEYIFGSGNTEGILRNSEQRAVEELQQTTAGFEPALIQGLSQSLELKQQATQIIAANQGEKAQTQSFRAAAVTYAARMPNLGVSIKGIDKGFAQLSEMLGGIERASDLYGQWLATRGKEHLVQTTEAFIEQRRKRRGYAARSQYKGRGRKILEPAVAESVVVTNYGETAFLGFDLDRLNELTMAPDGGHKGFWAAYEFGRTFLMPQGIWVGPSGTGNQKRIKARISGGLGPSFGQGVSTRVSRASLRGQSGDRFYPTGGISAVIAHDPPMHSFRDAFKSTVEWANIELNKFAGASGRGEGPFASTADLAEFGGGFTVTSG